MLTETASRPGRAAGHAAQGGALILDALQHAKTMLGDRTMTPSLLRGDAKSRDLHCWRKV
jgi:hypothetical protein